MDGEGCAFLREAAETLAMRLVDPLLRALRRGDLALLRALRSRGDAEDVLLFLCCSLRGRLDALVEGFELRLDLRLRGAVGGSYFLRSRTLRLGGRLGLLARDGVERPLDGALLCVSARARGPTLRGVRALDGCLRLRRRGVDAEERRDDRVLAGRDKLISDVRRGSA